MLNVSFKFMYLPMRLLMLFPAQHFLPLYIYWSIRRANRKSECISIIILVMPKQYQSKKYNICVVLMQLHLDSENLCMWCLTNRVDSFWEILFQNLWNNSARIKQLTKQRFNNKQTVEKEFFIHIIEICCNSGMLFKSYRYLLLN